MFSAIATGIMAMSRGGDLANGPGGDQRGAHQVAGHGDQAGAAGGGGGDLCGLVDDEVRVGRGDEDPPGGRGGGPASGDRRWWSPTWVLPPRWIGSGRCGWTAGRCAGPARRPARWCAGRTPRGRCRPRCRRSPDVPTCAPVGDGLAAGERTGELDVDGRGTGGGQGRVEGDGRGERVVHVGDVPALVVGVVELHVEPHRVGQVPHDRVEPCERVLAGRSSSDNDSSGVVPAARPSAVTWAGVIAIRSVTSRAQTTGRRSGGTTEKASKTIFAASESTETFHSVVGRVLPFQVEHAAHQDEPLQQQGQFGLELDRQGEVRQRAGDQPGDLAGTRADSVDQTRVAWRSRCVASGRAGFGVTDALRAVGLLRGDQRLQQAPRRRGRPRRPRSRTARARRGCWWPPGGRPRCPRCR